MNEYRVVLLKSKFGVKWRLGGIEEGDEVGDMKWSSSIHVIVFKLIYMIFKTISTNCKTKNNPN